MRPIDADALVAKMKAYDIWHETEYQDGYFDGFSDGIAEVEEAPTIEAEVVKHATWKLHRNGEGTCSNCKRTFADVWDFDNFDNYCAHCGAKMDLEETWLM